MVEQVNFVRNIFTLTDDEQFCIFYFIWAIHFVGSSSTKSWNLFVYFIDLFIVLWSHCNGTTAMTVAGV